MSLECLDDPADGSLYVFVSRDARKCKMLRFDGNGWILYYCTMCEGAFRWGGGYSIVCTARANGLMPMRYLEWLLEEMPYMASTSCTAGITPPPRRAG